MWVKSSQPMLSASLASTLTSSRSSTCSRIQAALSTSTAKIASGGCRAPQAATTAIADFGVVRRNAAASSGGQASHGSPHAARRVR